jgi:isovaleryl-CoA dehydrogenase
VDHQRPDADTFVIYAKTDAAAGPKGFPPLSSRRAPGFSTAQKLDKLGMRGSSTCELVFDNCRVPQENLLGPCMAGSRC